MTDKETRSGEAASVQKQTDDALRDAVWRLESIIEGTHVGTWEWNVQTGETVYNEVWAQIIGFTLDELAPSSIKTFETFVHPDDLKQSDELLEKHFRGELPYYDHDCRMKHKDGHWVWVHDRGRVITRTGDGKPLMMFGTHTDITERKQAEEALVSSLSLLKSTMESTADGILVVDLNGRITLWNHKFADMWHIPEELLSDRLDETALNYVLEQLAQPETFLGKIRELYGRPEESSEDRLDLADGRIFQRYSQPERIGDEIVGRVWSFSDITERKRAEDETRRERAFFDQLVETAPEGIAITDPHSKVIRVNAEFVRMFGYRADEAVGQNIDDLVAFPACEEEAREISKSTNQGKTVLLETTRRRKDGSLIDVSIIGAPILIAGKQEANYAIYRDTTERKQAEAVRQKVEAQLRQSQKMEAIGTLAGGVAHDFNNLLTGILGNIALMRTSLPPGDPLLENLNGAETAARQAADLTKGLLTFGRSAMVLPVPMNTTTALEASLVLLKQSLPATMEIVRDDRKTAWNVLLDQSQMTQILLNLAVNARDAMEGRGTLTIGVRNEVVGEEYLRAHPFARTGEFVHLSVTDTGPGIPPEILEHLFEPFHTTKPAGFGTGLGLSIVYGAVKQAGGWITAVSTEGAGKTAPQIEQTYSGETAPQKHPSDWKNILGGIEQTSSGATFDIYLPRCLEEPRESVAPPAAFVNAGSGTVLVVEDEPVVRTVAQTFLSRSGYVVLSAPDGASALNVLQEHLTDIGLILLDMTMPGMTIDEIVKAIRALNPTAPILLNSGYTTNDTVKQMLDEGSVQGFLGKPYDLHQLLEAVQVLLHAG